MREDAGPETEDDDESQTADHRTAGDGFWDETLLGGAGDGSAADEDPADEDPAETGEDAETGESAETSGNVAGEFRPTGSIEPGTPNTENALFVVFGAYLAVLGLTRLFVDVQGFDARDLLVLTGGTLLVSVVLLGFFGVITPDT